MIELINGKQKKDLPFKELAKRYLEYDHNWRESTLKLNTYKLNYYLQIWISKKQDYQSNDDPHYQWM